jgi:hypothetical protein
MPDFISSLIDPVSGNSSLSIDDGCSTLTFTDYANFDTNTEPGHARADFSDYRRVTIIRGTQADYVMSSIAGDGDEQISPASTTNDTINYAFQTNEVDNIFEVRICNYPTWNVAVAYEIGDVTYYDGVLYQALGTTTPAATPDTTPAEWEAYEPTPEEELLTKYCTVEKIVVLCISILKCQEQLVHAAFCLIDADFCNDDVLCKNHTFMAAVKLNVLLANIEYAVNRQAWDEVERNLDLMKTICNCR